MPHDHLRVLAHPLRMRILSLLTGTAMSAAEVARELGETQANISYHLRRLHEADLVEVAEEVQIRGGRAKRYRHHPDSGRRLTRRNPGEEQLLTKAIVGELLRRASQRAADRPASLTDAELWVDPESWARVVKQASALSQELHDAAQPPRTPGTVRVSASVALFELAGQSADPDEPR
jgi:DNA-binding transcriptional ArsR family regulator